ncbi:hypothetical protein PV326_010867 [Microctonus aethiopoides]|nr:hypothetical protein PV326_010867 [Microctonus aethiopoides]
MMYHKPTVPRFRIAERVSVSVNKAPIYGNKLHGNGGTSSGRNCGFTSSNINRGKTHNKGPSPVHPPGTPNRSGIQSPKPTLNGADPISRQNSTTASVYDSSRIQESHYDTVKPVKQLMLYFNHHLS